MRSLDITASTLRVRLRGWDRLLAAKSDLEIPLAHLAGAEVRSTADAIRESGKIRAPGTSLPGVIRAGTYRSPGDRQFWMVRRGQRVVVVELKYETYSKIVMEVDDPDGLVDRINAAIRGERPD